ncbi:phenazine biosynthesis protein PhzF family protein [Escherichia coli]|uniref:Phenazine biosynthesis protein PhzF family protein n=1 Tax=Escherichia coli TaxID=562 RepID=A0A2X3JGP3_ECOLX|nr:phenazine biosynthesis protein PhzF family protein [Escherichia coli]
MYRAKVLGLGNCTIWQTSLAGKTSRGLSKKHNDDYRISLEQGTPGFEPPLEGETREAIINALHLTEDDILPGLANSGRNNRTLKSDDPVETGSGYRRPFA